MWFTNYNYIISKMDKLKIYLCVIKPAPKVERCSDFRVSSFGGSTILINWGGKINFLFIINNCVETSYIELITLIGKFFYLFVCKLTSTKILHTKISVSVGVLYNHIIGKLNFLLTKTSTFKISKIFTPQNYMLYGSVSLILCTYVCALA